MAANSKDVRITLFKINQLVAEELLNSTGTDFKNEFGGDPSASQLGLDATSAYQAALREVGQRRLAEARKSMSSVVEADSLDLDAASARLLLSKLVAANDPLVTLAARKLDTFGDAEVIALVKELIEVGAINRESLS